MSENMYDVMGRHVRLVPTNMDGVMAIAPPPSDFDPLKASRSDLLRNGIIPMPDPERNPRAAAAWKRNFRRPLHVIVPEMTARKEKRQRVLTPRPGEATAYSQNWGGALLYPPSPSTDPFKSVYGSWIVPSVQPAASGDGDWYSVTWIGVDGYGSSDVMQLGTGQHVNVTNGQTIYEYFAWIEWYTNAWVTIGLAVNPGDMISASITNMGVQNGVLQASGAIQNLSTGQSTAPTVTAPAGTIFQGNVAEWIMERPSFNGDLWTLPHFGGVAFEGGFACTNSSAAVYANQGTPVSMTSDGTATGTALTETSSSTDWWVSYE